MAVETEAKAPRRRRRWWIGAVLAIPFIATLIPPFYNRTDPAIGGMPFFYWYQLAWIAGSVACTLVVYFVTRKRR